MKKETAAAKLAKLLGLDPESEAVKEVTTTPEQKKRADRLNPITLDEIDAYRAANGILLFLQAPELFTAQTCKHCKEGFIVSRRYVAYCSYTCLKRELEKTGIDWEVRKAQDDLYVRRVWEGNEPLRIPPAAIKILQEIANEQPTEQEASD